MKLKKLKPTKGIHLWCGTTALSMLTGRTVGYCAQLAAEAASATRWSGRGGFHYIKHTRKTIKGVANDEMHWAINAMKHRMVPITGYRGMTLFKMFETMPTAHWREALLIEVTDHYVVGQLGRLFDNHTIWGQPHGRFWCRKRKVVNVWKVTKA
jgi:hypothetical protein